MKKILSLLSLLLSFGASAVTAAPAADSAQASGSGSTITMIVYFAVIIFIFYFLLIRPQKKKEKEAQAMIDALKKGDKITTIGGFHGKVLSVKNGVLTLLIGENKVKLDSWAVKSVDKAAKEKPEDAEDAEDFDDTVAETEELSAEKTEE